MWWPTSRTTRLDEDISQHKERRQHPHGGGDALEVATEGVEEHIAYQTDEDAVADAEAEGHHHHRDEGRQRLDGVFPVDFQHGCHHHAHYNERRGGGG